MNITIRKIQNNEIRLLETFLYEAIFVPDGEEAPEYEIIYQPELQIYIKGFCKRQGDNCLVAEVDGKVVGAVWVRIMNDYGHVDNNTPSLAISVLKEYRNNGIGSKLLKAMIEQLKMQGYKQVSLSVQKHNYAVRMYRKADFEIYDENDEEYIMTYRLENIL